MRQHPTTGPGISPHSAYLYGRCVVAAVRLLGGVWGWDDGLGFGRRRRDAGQAFGGQRSVGRVWAMAGRSETEFQLLDFLGT